ncbi:uncharacterized protein si:dkey-121j17.6 [Danio aesculapii]|uniref:uncharacterized protein si:dkey-121j17.6 n=1 Tax=Danio aesculapii TaxID=1142201 RepID=UPI0024BF5D9B|nr:uncharacterized protein si:dkey-121j17.6 [Danio aesculapii]
MANKQLALQVVCALICSEKQKQKKKKKRIWKRNYVERRGRPAPAALTRELKEETMTPNAGLKDLPWMTSEEFEFLLSMVGPLITKQHTKMRRAITAKDRLYVTLLFLATGETFSSLSAQYKIGASTTSQIVMETCVALYQVMKTDYLKTPSTEAEWRAVAHDFESKWQFPHCLGALGGKRIYIQPPAKTGTFDNYKGRCFVTATAAVDANYKFIYISVDTHVMASDAGPFAQSGLCKWMDSGLLNCPPPEPLANSDLKIPYMFVGDETYPLRPDLMKPYPSKPTDRSQQILNYRLSRAQRAADNAFGILANRCRFLRNTIYLEPEKVLKILTASLCIHNFLLERRSEAYAPPGLADWEKEDHSLVEGTWRDKGTGSLQPAEQKRECNASVTAKMQQNFLCDYFVSPAGCVPWQEQHISNEGELVFVTV